MQGFDPATSFGYDASKRYDADDIRGDEQETVAFLAGIARRLSAARSETARVARLDEMGGEVRANTSVEGLVEQAVPFLLVHP